MEKPEVREYSELIFKKTELVSFPGVGVASSIGTAKGFKITRSPGDDFVLVRYEGNVYEISPGIVGVLKRAVKG